MTLPTKPVPEGAPPRLPEALARAARRQSKAVDTAAHHFTKAFPVLLRSDRGVLNGVGRNITETGMFIETRDVCPMGSELQVIFEAPSIGTELTAVAEVRFQAFLNFAGRDGDEGHLRGVGVRFLRFEAGRPGLTPATSH
jgi:hypothetical protein